MIPRLKLSFGYARGDRYEWIVFIWFSSTFQKILVLDFGSFLKKWKRFQNHGFTMVRHPNVLMQFLLRLQLGTSNQTRKVQECATAVPVRAHRWHSSKHSSRYECWRGSGEYIGHALHVSRQHRWLWLWILRTLLWLYSVVQLSQQIRTMKSEMSSPKTNRSTKIPESNTLIPWHDAHWFDLQLCDGLPFVARSPSRHVPAYAHWVDISNSWELGCHRQLVVTFSLKKTSDN